MKKYTILLSLAGLLLIIVCATGNSASANSLNERFALANGAYSKGNYHQATALYEALTDSSGYAPGLLFNLANSYLKQGKTGKAILNYERALRLSPGDGDIAGNLALARKENTLFGAEPTLAYSFGALFNLDQWSLLALGGLLVFTLFRLSLLKPRLRPAAATTISFLLLAFIGIAGAGMALNYQRFNPGVVTETEGRLLISPFPGATSTGTIREGRLVYPEKQYRDFVYVTDETMRQGWLHRDSIEQVVPE